MFFGCSPFKEKDSNEEWNESNKQEEEINEGFRNYVSRSANVPISKLMKFKEKFEGLDELDQLSQVSPLLIPLGDKGKSFNFKELEAVTIKNSQETKYKLILFKRTIFYFVWENGIYVYKGVYLLSYSYVSKITEVSFQNQIYYKMRITSHLNYSKFRVIFYAKSQNELQDFISPIRKEQRKIKRHYNFECKIAKGEFGTVIQARNIKTKEKVAVKVLKKRQETKFLDMIKWEVEVFRLFLNNHHRSIASPIEMFESVNTIYLVFEFASTLKLDDYLNRRKYEDTSTTLEILTQVAEGIDFIHKLGVVHRDIKADNVVMTRDMKGVKLIDFGLSKVMGPNEKTNEWYGSLVYSAPEIITKTSYNHQVDIWSLGVLMYFCLYSRYPFDLSKDEKYLASQIIKGKINLPLGSCNEMTKLIKFCLEINSDRRLKINHIIKILRLIGNKVLL